MTLAEQFLKLNSDYAILWQVLMSILGTVATYEESLVPKIMAELEEFVARIEGSRPPGDPQSESFRRSLEGFREILERSRLIDY